VPRSVDGRRNLDPPPVVREIPVSGWHRAPCPQCADSRKVGPSALDTRTRQLHLGVVRYEASSCVESPRCSQWLRLRETFASSTWLSLRTRTDTLPEDVNTAASARRRRLVPLAPSRDLERAFRRLLSSSYRPMAHDRYGDVSIAPIAGAGRLLRHERGRLLAAEADESSGDKAALWCRALSRPSSDRH
jgi:hypothetical protein